MDIDGHDIISMLFISSIYILGLLSILGTPLYQYLFLISFILFSTRLNPDIDMKLPFVGHRGITHKYQGILIVSLLMIIGFMIVLPYFKINISSNIVIPIILGFAFGWFIHTIVDWLYDKMQNLSWLVILVFVALVGYLVSNNWIFNQIK